MDPNLANRVPQIIEIEEDDVIDLDGSEKTPEEVIYEWDAKIRKKLSMFGVADNENILGDLMKEYLQSLQDIARSYEDNVSLKNKVFCHISFLYSYYVELQCYTPSDNYLNNMEDILTLYCNLELEVIRPLKKKDLSKREFKRRILSVCRRIIHVLTVYLLERNDHILHVLIKMNTNNVSDSCSEVLNVLYTHFLTKVPVLNLCDESFCRSYILFQKWKEIRKVEDWEGMDKIMYKMFKRTPESIKNNETLRQILMPACQSPVGIVLNLFRSFRDISSAYFKHVIAKKNIEMDDIDFNIDLGEDEPTLPIEDENEEEVTFLKAYYEVERNMSNLPQNLQEPTMSSEMDLFTKCKEEVDEDDDVEFVGIITAEPQPTEKVVVDDDIIIDRTNTASQKQQPEETATEPSLLISAKENSDLENLNGITKIAETPNICSSEPETIAIGPVSSSTSSETALENTLFEITSVSGCVTEPDIEANQPEVPLVSNTTQVPSPSAIKDSDLVCETSPGKRTIEMKSVEVQAETDTNYVYNDYGLTTPPFEVLTDEHSSRSVEPCVYTNIGQSSKNIAEPETRNVEVQVEPLSSDKNCYDDYGLTPPNDTPIDDHHSRVSETCLYTNIGQSHKKLGGNISSEVSHRLESKSVNTQGNGNVSKIDSQIEVNFEPEILPNTKKKTDRDDSEYEDYDNQIDKPETNTDAEDDTEEIDIESCHETDKDSPLVDDESSNHTPACEPSDIVNFKIRINPAIAPPIEDSSNDQSSNQIDTGQELILNTAPNIKDSDFINGSSSVDSQTKDLSLPVPETFNGNTVLKPLLSSNRTNGQTKDVPVPPKIMYTSSQKIKSTSLDDFSKFESAIQSQWNKMKENHDFDDVMTSPVTKITPAKHTNFLNPQDKLDIFGSQESKPMSTNSRSNSPMEMTSPAYEAIDDFRNYFSDSVNGCVPPPPDVRVPQGILKKNNSTRKKNFRIMFHESTCDNSEERRPRSDGVLVPKRVRRDRKLNMEPKVVVERLSFIENKIKKVLNNPPTLRVDYDKTTRHINPNDVVRCISPPRFSWIIDFSQSRHTAGKVKRSNDDYCKKVLAKCEKNQSNCCNQLAEQFNKLNCNVTEDKALNLSIPDTPLPHPPADPETEFSNSPTFLQDPDQLVQQCLQETSIEATPTLEAKQKSSFLSDNSNFYKSETSSNSLNLSSKIASKSDTAQINNSESDLISSKIASKSQVNNSESDLSSKKFDDSLIQLPTAVPESYDFEKNLKNEVFSKIDWQSLEKEDSDTETRLPLKKRKLSVANKNENAPEEPREEKKKEEISYPATPMISIAEVEALHLRKLSTNSSRPFKTPAERKEMPPLPVFYNVDSDPSPIITDQFNINNHTYNNPTINYHMNNVPVPFINIPCGSYYSLPPILVPFNNVSTFDQSKVNPQQQEQTFKKENRKQGRQRRRH